MPTSADINTATLVGDKLTRTRTGAFISLNGTATKLATTDDAMVLPIGTELTVTNTSTHAMSMSRIIKDPAGDADSKTIGTRIKITASAGTNLDAIIGGLVTFRETYEDA